ncbi:Glycoside hydrolase family 76 protein [Mycena kentingensis (nom. inval.)]|nr:Glycoside hydrolase family 76 protein [Mycena kentingensis (nom. inval.)]
MPRPSAVLFSTVLTTLCAVANAAIDSASWRSPSFTQDNGPRTHIANAGMLKAMDVLHTPGLADEGQNYEWMAHVYGHMAEMAFINSEASFDGSLQVYFSTALGGNPVCVSCHLEPLPSNPPSCGQVDYALAYGYSSLRAYFTTKNATFLEYAVQTWRWAARLTIPVGAGAGDATRIDVKLSEIALTCANATMAGGTFATSSASDPTVSARATGYFTLLSAMLAQATSNTTYLSAAVSSATFLRNHLWDADKGIVVDAINAQAGSCQVDASSRNADNSGLLLEALSVLSAITGYEERVSAMLNELIVRVLEYSEWQTQDGIIANGDTRIGDGLLVRALGWAYLYNATTPETRGYVYDYIAVQFNAVTQLATTTFSANSSATNIYAAQWTGPPPPADAVQVILANQTNAVHVLMAAALLDLPQDPTPPRVELQMPEGAFVFANSTSSSAPGGGGDDTKDEPNPQPSTKTSPNRTVIIAAAVGGGVGLLLLLAALAFFLARHRRQRRQTTDRISTDPTSPSHIRPYANPYAELASAASSVHSNSHSHSCSCARSSQGQPRPSTSTRTTGSTSRCSHCRHRHLRYASEPQLEIPNPQSRPRKGVATPGIVTRPPAASTSGLRVGEEPPPEYAVMGGA